MRRLWWVKQILRFAQDNKLEQKQMQILEKQILGLAEDDNQRDGRGIRRG